jgi:hypothetical protein
VVAVAATLPPEDYERVVDRLRHAEQYADAARRMAKEALGAFRAEDKEVVAMLATVAPETGERLMDRLRHAEQFAEAARAMAEDALDLLEALERKEDHDA